MASGGVEKGWRGFVETMWTWTRWMSRVATGGRNELADESVLYLTIAMGAAVALLVLTFAVRDRVRRKRARKSEREALMRHRRWANEEVDKIQREMYGKLIVSVYAGDFGNVRSLLKLGADPSQCFYDSNKRDTLLHFAARCGRRDIFDVLKRKMSPEEVERRNKDGMTAEDVFAAESKTPSVDAQSSKSDEVTTASNHSDRSTRSSYERTLLDVCARPESGANVALVKYIVQKQHVNPIACKNENGDTAIHSAARSGDLAVVRAMVSAASKTADCRRKLATETNEEGRTVLHVAVARSEKEDGGSVAEALLSALSDEDIRLASTIKDKRGDTMVHLAAKHNNGVFDRLLARLPKNALHVTDESGRSARDINIMNDPTMDVETFE